MKKSIDIVLPCYNPQTNWYTELLHFHQIAKERYAIRYILVNDGSVNSELEKALPALEAEEINFITISYSENKGKGFALRQGVLASQSNWVIYTDIDFPFTNNSVIDVIERILTNESDVVAGNRDAMYYRNKMSFFRKLLSKSFRFILKHLLRMKVTDTQCGLKAFNAKGKEEFLKTRINRYLFDFEFIYRCGKKNSIRILPVAVELKPNVEFSKMKIKILLQETFNLFKVILFS